MNHHQYDIADSYPRWYDLNHENNKVNYKLIYLYLKNKIEAAEHLRVSWELFLVMMPFFFQIELSIGKSIRPFLHKNVDFFSLSLLCWDRQKRQTDRC